MNREPYQWECDEQSIRAQRIGAFAAVWFVAILLASLYSTCGCAPVKAPETPLRATARAAVSTLARAVALADHLCGERALDTKDVFLADTCERAFNVARPSLLAAEHGIDAWEAGHEGQVACSVAQAVVALEDMRKAVNAAGDAVPSLIDDALAVGNVVGGGCRHGS